MAENEWVTGVKTLWGGMISHCFFVVAFQTSKLCANLTDGSRKIETNAKITVCRDLSMHKLPAFMWQNWSNLAQLFLRWWFFITHLKTISSKRQLFSPPQKMVVKRKQKPWNDDLGNCLRFLWLDSADDTRNSENQHSEALHFCRPGNNKRSGRVTANHGYQEFQ